MNGWYEHFKAFTPKTVFFDPEVTPDELRHFENWTKGETRVWWVNGKVATVSAHLDAPDFIGDFDIKELDKLAPAVASLGPPFITTDLVRQEDGRMRVVEVGGSFCMVGCC